MGKGSGINMGAGRCYTSPLSITIALISLSVLMRDLASRRVKTTNTMPFILVSYMPTQVGNVIV